MKKSKIFLGAIIAVALCCSMSISAFAAAPSIHISSPCPSTSDALFTVKGETVYFDVSVSNNPDKVELFWPSTAWFRQAKLSKVSGATSLYEAFEKNSGDNDYTAKGRTFKQFEIRAKNGDGTTKLARNYAVLYLSSNDEYRTIAPNLSWSFQDVTPFVYPKAKNYNCAAYVFNVYDEWMQNNKADFNSDNTIKVAKLDEFMFKTGSYSSRSGTKYTQRVSSNQYPKVVYYRNYHFAKVLAWNSDGTPRSTQSKWGEAEVVNTYGYNVYTSNSYGAPVYYYK